MRRFFPYVSLVLFIVSACSPHIHNKRPEIPGIIVTDTISQKFNLQLDFMKNHFSGLLIARRMNADEVRLLFTTYFGLSVFDFSLRGDSLHVNSCIEPMRKKKVLSLLEQDFKIIFLSGQDVHIKEKSSIFEKRTSGKWMGKAIVSISEFVDNQPQRVHIKHPWIRLKIQLDKLEQTED